jgi:hypothetical protein
MVPDRSLVPGLILVAITLTTTLPNVYGGSYWTTRGQIECNGVVYGLRGGLNITLTSNGQSIAFQSLYCLGHQVNIWPIRTLAKPDGWKMTVFVYDPTNPTPPVCSATGSGARFPGTVTLDKICPLDVANATGTIQRPVRG